MRRVYKAIAAIAICSAVLGCSKLTDTPSVTFNEDSYILPASGGELIIPVRSTGVDEARISFSDHSNWEVAENGDMVPADGWIKIIKIIKDYQTTRDLAEWSSGIVVSVEPNSSKHERSAQIIVESFSASDEVRVTQSGSFVK